MMEILEYSKIKKILIPTNKNPLMKKGIDFITKIFPDAEYYLVGVVDISGESLLLYSSYSAEYLDILETLEKEAINEAVEILKSKNSKIIDSVLLRGYPSKTILNYASKNEINLILLTTSSKVGSEQIKLGSTAKIIIEKSKIPILLITPFSKCNEVKSILNPTSGSKYSFRASMLSINFAKHFNAKVKMLHLEKIKNIKMLNIIKEYASNLNVELSIEEVINENLVHRIVEESKAHDLMIASRGRRGFAYKFRYFSPELALGRLEREVIELSSVPIMLVNE
ncbi:MAG: universal stress protein [Thermoplasmata archaeon]